MFGDESDEEGISNNVAAIDDTSNDSNAIRYGVVLQSSSVGGGRAVYASCDIEAGQLIVAEMPCMVWTDFDLSDPLHMIAVLEELLRDANAKQVTLNLHPRTFSDIDPAEKFRIIDFLSINTLNSLTSIFQLPTDEIIRISLVLQHNGFGTGLYEQLCYFNHSCEPNCIKFSPKNRYSASEIWTTRKIPKGDELTICYVYPQENTLQYMREYLLINHGFHCACIRCIRELAVESNDNKTSTLLINMIAMETELIHQQVCSYYKRCVLYALYVRDIVG
jgi:WD40 repeat protein